MKKIRNIILILIILFLGCFSQVHAAKLSIDSNVDIIQDNAELKDAIKRSTYNALLSNESTLESSYHLKRF